MAQKAAFSRTFASQVAAAATWQSPGAGCRSRDPADIYSRPAAGSKMHANLIQRSARLKTKTVAPARNQMAGSNRKKRNRRRFHRRTPPGAPPGIVEVDPKATPPSVRLIAFGPQALDERALDTPATLLDFLGKWPVTWVNVEGLGDAATIRELGRLFALHPLALEDVVNVHQRPKVEQYGDHLFVVARMVRYNGRLETEQVSMFLGRGFVLTFLEDPGDAFDPVRQRLRGGQGRIRAASAGYLAYSLLDAVIDAYFPVIEAYGDRLERLEDSVIARPDRAAIAEIHEAKHELRHLRRTIWPLRDAVNELARDDSSLIDADTRVYLRDCYDHTIQIIDLVETYRELGADLSDLYLSSLSNRMNEVIKVLTIISTIFMPLSFIAGVYGMNFNTQRSPWNMPELNWAWGYLFALGLMAGVAALMLSFFHRQGWLAALRPPASGPPEEKARRA
ncbi:MAG: magnesium/cobalt transporter CorA [Pirellulales bacterium]